MRTTLHGLVATALSRGQAVPAITAYNFSTAAALVSAAESTERGLVILVAPARFARPDGKRFVTALRKLADSAGAPVCIQFDHASDPAQIRSAVDSGADAVLVDGSALPLAQNATLVRNVRAEFPYLSIEAELGALAGNEDQSLESTASGFTDATLISGFLEESHAQLLAVSVGNVHGAYSGDPQLRWEIIREAKRFSSVPLVLHGATGIPVEDLRNAINLGFGKVNFNTELRSIVASTIEGAIAEIRAQGENILSLEQQLFTQTEQFAAALFDRFTVTPE